jgi:predicted secreted protein
MALDSDRYIMDDNPHDADGVGGTHWYYFKAVSPGECVILMMEGDVSGEPARHQAITYTIVVEEERTDTKIEVKSGQVFSISLDENQSIPYRWEPEISDGSLIELIREEIDTSGVTSDDSEPMPGSGGEKHIFYFEALRAGECMIDMNWADIRDGGIGQTESYTIIIEQ